MKQVFVAKNPAEAHLLQGLLQAEGIAAEVQGEWLFGAMGELPFTPETWPSVWVVQEEDAERASQFVREFERGNREVV